MGSGRLGEQSVLTPTGEISSCGEGERGSLGRSSQCILLGFRERKNSERRGLGVGGAIRGRPCAHLGPHIIAYRADPVRVEWEGRFCGVQALKGRLQAGLWQQEKTAGGSVSAMQLALF